jgi:hypothetical protein
MGSWCVSASKMRFGLLALFAPSWAGCDALLADLVAGSPSNPGRAAATATTGDDLGARVAAAYASLDVASCQTAARCADELLSASGSVTVRDAVNHETRPNPKSRMANPEPEWLLGWDSLPSSDELGDALEVFEALAKAKLARHQAEECRREFEAVHAANERGDRDFAAQVEAAERTPNFYARIDALLAIEKSMPTQPSWVTYEWEPRWLSLHQALARVRDTGGRPWGLWGQLPAAERRALDAELKLRPVRARLPKADELLVYCAKKASGERSPEGLWQTARLEAMNAGASPRVRPAVDWKATLAVLERATAREAADREALAPSKTSPKLTNLRVGDEPESSSTPGALVFTQGAVKSVRQDGVRTLAELFTRTETLFDYDCVETRRVVGVTPSGAFQFEIRCKEGKRVEERTVKLEFTELPPGMALQVGDEVEVVGVLRSAKRTHVSKASGSPRVRDEADLEGRHLESLTRPGAARQKWYSHAQARAAGG